MILNLSGREYAVNGSNVVESGARANSVTKMSRPPEFHIDLARFASDPHPDLARMRREAPIAHVPELDAVLFTRRDDIHRHEKRVDVLSSDQPGGLMTVLMGQNMMRKDGEAHMRERRALFPSFSPRTVADHWKPKFTRPDLAPCDRQLS